MAQTLKDYFRDRITSDGPITIARYFEDCMTHREFGYYRTHGPLGREGDFITAPEISQVFGELLGLWALDMWHRGPALASMNLIELGPGRGTLMSDFLRATSTDSAFHEALNLHLVEVNPTLRRAQTDLLNPYDPSWHDGIDTIPPGPSLIIANEFFDALPIHQFIFEEAGWRERAITLDARGDLAFTTIETAIDTTAFPEAAPGDIYEYAPARTAMMAKIADRLMSTGGVALIIDYGTESWAIGDSLQAVKQHQMIDLLQTPGGADLSSHVDFQSLINLAGERGLNVLDLQTQGRFLGHLGIALRAEQLCQRLPASEQEIFLSGIDRLIAPDKMGNLFKCLCLCHPDYPIPAGFTSSS